MNHPPLSNILVVEFAGLAPGPFAGLILADWGATVIRIDKKDQIFSTDVLSRGKRSLATNTKNPAGLDVLKRLITKADVLIDPFRPGVMERLGLAPSIFLGNPTLEVPGCNTGLVYARICGFPSSGPQRLMAGHDLNYLAQSGLLSIMPPVYSEGELSKPSFPLNILADFAGGGMTCALVILLALIERSRSGLGQIVDNNMVDGARYVASFPIIHSSNRRDSPWLANDVGKNLLDGGAPFYNLYVCKDCKWMSVACLEPQFYKVFLSTLLWALNNSSEVKLKRWRSKNMVPRPETQMDTATWPDTKVFLRNAFLELTRDEWAKIFHGTDACATPVLALDEVPIGSGGQPNPSPPPHPLLSRTPSVVLNPSEDTGGIRPGRDTLTILRDIVGLSEDEVGSLQDHKVISLSPQRAKM